MIWKFTAYNGTTCPCPISCYLPEAITLFTQECSLTQWDIKTIENLH